MNEVLDRGLTNLLKIIRSKDHNTPFAYPIVISQTTLNSKNSYKEIYIKHSHHTILLCEHRSPILILKGSEVTKGAVSTNTFTECNYIEVPISDSDFTRLKEILIAMEDYMGQPFPVEVWDLIDKCI